jgi:hypothetical protein
MRLNGAPQSVLQRGDSWGRPTTRDAKRTAVCSGPSRSGDHQRPTAGVNQNQPGDNKRFYAKIERMTGQRREVRPRGQPRLDAHVTGQAIAAWPL